MTYVVLGATGRTGQIITRRLLDAGKSVRAVSRSAERVQPLVDQGAEAAIGSLKDAAFLEDVMRGATAAYLLIPASRGIEDLSLHQDEVGTAIATAVARSGVPNAVNLSSVGADLSEGTGPVLGLHRQEQRLDAIPGLNVLHLRAAYFMENILGMLGMVREAQILGTSMHVESPIPMIATRDIGSYAARRLLHLDFADSSAQPLLGPENVAWNRVAQLLGSAIGVDLSYVQFSPEETRQGLMQAGLSSNVADLFVELYDRFNEGHPRLTGIPRTEENTTPTSLKQFASTFAAAYQSARP